MRKLRLTALLAVTLCAGLACQAALGYWTGEDTRGGGEGAAGAATLNQGAVPTATVTAASGVVLNWGGSSLSNGVAAAGYLVTRYNELTGVEATNLPGCSGTVLATTCTATGTPVGDWEYSVTPVFGTNWRGEESLKSGAVDTGPGLMTLSTALFGGTIAPLPAVATGTVSNFSPEAAIEFFLDGSVPLTGSPSQVGADGTASFSVTMPDGIADGPHSLSIRSSGAEASAGILVDNTAPSIDITVDPPPNAAGWNRTAPVAVGGTVDDGNGSGVAYAKYTEDGSDPKTSPTAQYQTVGAVSVTTTTTLRFFLADNAGNESPVETQEVQIDTALPFFTVAVTDVEGGVYQAPGAPEEPGNVFYRGVDAGSLRFLLTPLPSGGSAVVSAGFSALTADAVGFSFDSSTVTTPTGGPYLSNPFSWVAGTTSTPSGTISLSNEAGSSFGAAGLLHNDSTAPAGGAVEASGLVGTGGRYSMSLTLTLDLAKGADAGSGLADGSGPSDLPAELLRAEAPLSSDGVANGSCGTYSAFAQVGSDDPAASLSETVPTNNSCYLYRYLVSDHVGNVATYTSGEIKVQTTAAASLRPTDAVLTPVTGLAAQWVTGSTVFYNPAQLGSFSVDTTASAPYAGIAQIGFPAITGFSGGGAETSPTSANNFRSTYAWSANGVAPSPGAQALTATNNLGETSTNATAFSVLKDDLGPSGGSVEASGLVGTGGRYSTSLTLSLAFAPGTDAGAGLAPSGAQLQRASAPLSSDGTSDGSCGTFGAYTQVGANDPASPKADTVPADRTCYRYQYAVPDRVGNLTLYTSSEIKVDATAPPAPALSFSALSNAYWSGAGTAVFYRPSATSGGFQLTAASADLVAGAASYGFPTLPAGWSSSSGGAAVRNYSWSAANPVAPSGAQSVTTVNNAGRTAASSFTVTPDATVPTGGSLLYTNGYSLGSTVSVSFGKGTDTISGLNAASGIIEASTATLSAGSCGSFGAFAVIATNPLSGVSLPVTSGTCYQYRYLISDNVGNQATYTSASVTKVDTVAPSNSLSLESPVNASQSGNTIYYRGSVAGSFKIVDVVADAASGPASATFPAIGTTGWTHDLETVSTPAGGPYTSSLFSWTPNPANPVTKSVIGTDVAGKSSTNASINFASDIVAPSGGGVSYANGVVNSVPLPVAVANGSDAASGINATTTTIKRDVAPLSVATETCAAFPGTYAATVTLVAGADPGVTSGNCYRYEYLVSDKVGNQATYTSASVAKVDTSGPRVTSIESRQSNGTAGNGRLEIGDKLILTFNQSLASASVPASFSGASEDRPLSADVTLTIPGLTQGALDTGSATYIASPQTTATFGGTGVLANNGIGTTVTIAVTSLGGAATAAGSGALVFNSAASITDGGGNPSSGTFTTAAGFKLF